MNRTTIAILAGAGVLVAAGAHRAATAPAAAGTTIPAASADSTTVLAAAVTQAPAGSSAAQVPGYATGGGVVKAYDGLVALTSADTNLPVSTVVARLRGGETLDQVAGAADATVKTQANDYVRVVADLAVANHRLTAAQAQQAEALCSGLVRVLMAADVSAYIPAGADASGG